jgi:hypothetical protein
MLIDRNFPVAACILDVGGGRPCLLLRHGALLEGPVSFDLHESPRPQRSDGQP